jgi:3-isopropylmalate/(R)-2-methylmalate dehydratase small subunit
MALAKINQVIGKAVHVPGDDIDTDRIIPARFMKCITFDGLGKFLFYDIRKNQDGSDKKHNLNDPRFAHASILITGNNFGCGSSREHAPQSIYRAGFRAIIAENYAEIFFGNAINLGIPCVCACKSHIQQIVDQIQENPDLEIKIDLQNQKIQCGKLEIPCSLRPSAQEALLKGTWDCIGELLEGQEKVCETAQTLSYFQE